MEVTIMLQENRNLLPRKDVRITGITATPYDDRRRVRVEIEITPFAERPNLDISIMNFRVSFTLHLREIGQPETEYSVSVQLYYDEVDQPQHAFSVPFSFNPPPSCSKNMRLWRAQAPRKIRLNKQAKLGGHSDFGYTSMSQNHVI